MVSIHAKGDAEADFSSEVIARLSGRGGAFGRYALRGEIARGGMGAILSVWDEDLNRHLAMKVILGTEDPPAEPGEPVTRITPPVDPKRLARFLEEAQVTGQLDHPGIVPVHELGLDPQGRVYFTMKLVKGQTLKEVFDELDGPDARAVTFLDVDVPHWTRVRALGVLLKVCEAMAYAHDKGVIHRDLKPGNVMVGKYGEVYAMDWGLARVLGEEDKKDLRIRPEAPRTTSALLSERATSRSETPESPLYTMDGDVVGTPAYMSPEQASGDLARMGPHSDVYAVGAMLYHLLAGHMPYVPRGARLNNYAVWSAVQNGPPPPIHGLAPDAPAELVAICEKAMARAIAQRYRDMSELAADLGSYLEGRVVAAYQTGAWAESKKWVERNKPLATSLAAGVLALVAGLVVSLSLKEKADTNATLAEDRRIESERNEIAANRNAAEANRQAGIARANERTAKEQEALAKSEKANVLRLSAFQTLDDLEKEADSLWPAHPENIERYRAWLKRAEALIAGIPEHRAQVVEIEKRALPRAPAQDGGEWRFAADQDRWWHAQMEKLILALSAFANDRTGMAYGISPEHGWGIAKRLAFAESVLERSIDGAEARKLWAEAIEAIAQSEKYRGVKWPSGDRLVPQLGLLPVGADPESGLWEFAHVQTGSVPRLGPDRRLKLNGFAGLVFVLIPGGSFKMGAQRENPSGENYDPQAQESESPVREVSLDPYFLSKYEMMQGQWQEFTKRNPSLHSATNVPFGNKRVTRSHPVEQVSEEDCARVMEQLGLMLPTEAQWEHACRAGTRTPWWTGDDVQTLDGAANLADAFCKANGGSPTWVYEEWLDDGHAVHAPVGSLRANAFGLHDMHGNVWEWCRDDFGSYGLPVGPGDGLRIVQGARQPVRRGGGWYGSAANARSAFRTGSAHGFAAEFLGLRPARVITP